ncbi:MAG: radical SAM protein [Candidatus Eisenbacteria bacterium]|nr:radical SAM protein [Candidatus Eisenbacteria bacterium]
MMNSTSSVYVTTNGCPENRIDSARLVEFFKRNGWIITDNLQQADFIFFNACGLTQEAEEYSIKIIKYLQDKKRPSAELFVWGCLPKINESRVREVYQGITFGSDDLTKLDELFACETKAKELQANFLVPGFRFDEESGHRRASKGRGVLIETLKFIKKHSLGSMRLKLAGAVNVYGPGIFPIKVSTGCLNACSYCGVKLSRGNVKSKSIDSIMEEAEKGLDSNYREFGLIGTDVGAYGRDLGMDLLVLLRELVKLPGDFKMRLRNINPRFLIMMMPRLKEILRTGKISYIGTAAESGSDRILGLMNRGYRISEYKEAVRQLNREFPEILIRTQLMVGFPTESDRDFKETCSLLDDLRFDYVEVYRFQRRPGTRAALMDGEIDRETMKRRFHRLQIKSQVTGLIRKRQIIGEFKKRLIMPPANDML